MSVFARAVVLIFVFMRVHLCGWIDIKAEEFART